MTSVSLTNNYCKTQHFSCTLCGKVVKIFTSLTIQISKHIIMYVPTEKNIGAVFFIS